ncbi:hypothetical protein ANCCEY_08175 [Ancylostoma ceylanicum]|uniref:Translation elongation factor EFG/EF2 domain-containing protein n=1 Tax=Ancylostoma ceylanicum TaxID=53326 RepID=A0A0D6LL44_9BILA|nr:hypothetical protein ANCCEY_08175 [Ancylostoma ceylanicum]
MGELHLDIVKNRLIRDYGLNVFVGPLQVLNMPLNRKFPARNCLTFKVQVELPPDSTNVRSEWLKAINEGCRNALHNGPVLGFPMQDVMIKLRGITTSGGRVNPAVLSACAHKCVTEAIEAAGARLIEPIMQLNITLESGTEAQSILHELSRRRADILECSGTHC